MPLANFTMCSGLASKPYQNAAAKRFPDQSRSVLFSQALAGFKPQRNVTPVQFGMAQSFAATITRPANPSTGIAASFRSIHGRTARSLNPSAWIYAVHRPTVGPIPSFCIRGMA